MNAFRKEQLMQQCGLKKAPRDLKYLWLKQDGTMAPLRK